MVDASLAGAVALAIRTGRIDLDTVVDVAESKWWAWDTVKQLAPERLTFPRPKRSRGRDAEANVARDAMIALEVDLCRTIEPTVWRAYERVAEHWPMEAKAVESIYLRLRKTPTRR